MKMFGFQMDSELECSEFEPRLYFYFQWACNSPLKNAMVIGIDVYHDTTAKSTGRNSIAGFVSSLNDGN